VEHANLAAFLAFCWFSENLGFLNRNLSNKLPNWPNSVTVIGIRALLVFKISPMRSSPVRVVLEPLSGVSSYKTSPSLHRANEFHFSFFVGLRVGAGRSIGGNNVDVESNVVERGSPDGVAQEMIQFNGEMKGAYCRQHF